MADTVRTIVTHNVAPLYAINITNISDGTGESAVVKLDKSQLTGTKGNEPAALDILSCWGMASGCSHVRLHWDHTSDDTALVMFNGAFFFDYGHVGGLKDPRTPGGTGDILLTTSAMVANGGYCIDLLVAMRED